MEKSVFLLKNAYNIRILSVVYVRAQYLSLFKHLNNFFKRKIEYDLKCLVFELSGGTILEWHHTGCGLCSEDTVAPHS